MITTMALLLLAQQPPSEVGKLSWLGGCWTQEARGVVIEEQWMAPGGGIMMGMSRTVQDGRTLSYEFARIAPMLSGTLAYIAAPSGGAPLTFQLRSMHDGEAVFENLARDFPQRFIYRRDGPGTLKVRMEGLADGRPVRQDIDFKRCR